LQNVSKVCWASQDKSKDDRGSATTEPKTWLVNFSTEVYT